MIRYCCGFAFHVYDSDYVYLIEKQKPDWQKGLMNGIGGKIEQDETPVEAMVREFREETGIKTDREDWRYFLRLHNSANTWEVFFFVADIEHEFTMRMCADEVEEVRRVEWSAYVLCKTLIVPNLRWIIPLSRYNLAKPVEVEETG